MRSISEVSKNFRLFRIAQSSNYIARPSTIGQRPVEKRELLYDPINHPG